MHGAPALTWAVTAVRAQLVSICTKELPEKIEKKAETYDSVGTKRRDTLTDVRAEEEGESNMSGTEREGGIHGW